MSGCTSRQRRRYRFAPSAFSPRKPTPRRLRWTRRRTRLIPAGRKVFMRLKPSPNIVSSAPSSSPSADSRKNDSIPEPEGRASKNEHASLWAWTRSTRRNRRFLPEEGGQPGNAPRSASASGIWAKLCEQFGGPFSFKQIREQRPDSTVRIPRLFFRHILLLHRGPSTVQPSPT